MTEFFGGTVIGFLAGLAVAVFFEARRRRERSAFEQYVANATVPNDNRPKPRTMWG